MPNPNRRSGKRATSPASRKRCARRGEEFVETLGIRRRSMKVPRPWAAATGTNSALPRMPPPCAKRDVARLWTLPANLVAAGNAPPRGAECRASPNLRFAGRATRPTYRTSLTQSFDLVVSDLRRDVRSAADRRRARDGASDQARRTDRHGQLDSGRPDARRADPANQRRLHAAAARRLRQPDDLG